MTDDSVSPPAPPSEGTAEADERVVALERRLRAVERRLDLALAALDQVHVSRAWRLASAGRRAAAGVRLAARRLTHPLEWLRVALPRVLPARTRARLSRVVRRGRSRAPQGGAPPSPGVELHGEGEARPTILVLPIIEWEFRWQRPQQLVTRLAKRGWPVFYARLTLDTTISSVERGSESLAAGVWAVRLPGRRQIDPYREALDPAEVERLWRALAVFQVQERVHEFVVLVQHPTWGPLAERLKEELGWPVVYDLMDAHSAFSGSGSQVVSAEQSLLRRVDLVLATSAALERHARQFNAHVHRIPNGCDWERWSAEGEVALPEGVARPAIGYYGAIAEWFDDDLVVELATARPYWSFVLAGSTYGGPAQRLASLPNVHLMGEQAYEALPRLVGAFDACIVPFRMGPLTRATDPVKLYEMLALGKEVVATRLPELEAVRDLIQIADDADGFLRALDATVYRPPDSAMVERRRAFASANRWEKRAERVEVHLRELYPRVSIGIVTHNNVDLTRLCLASIYSRTEYPNFEVIVVDNGSTDGTAEQLATEADRHPGLRLVRNDANRGFAAACNQAFRSAEGEVLVFLNNDTVVSAGWLSSLVRALSRNPDWGLVGAVTNAIGNEARIPVGYRDLGELQEWASDHVWAHRGESFELPMVALFCAALRRDVWERVGELDERFEIGMFEDDDYCRRVRKAGFEIRCLRDCYVHHWQMAAFRLLGDAEYGDVYESNRRKLIDKWRSSVTSPAGAGRRRADRH